MTDEEERALSPQQIRDRADRAAILREMEIAHPEEAAAVANTRAKLEAGETVTFEERRAAMRWESEHHASVVRKLLKDNRLANALDHISAVSEMLFEVHTEKRLALEDRVAALEARLLEIDINQRNMIADKIENKTPDKRPRRGRQA